ncbi:HAMP domain-containing histidine kinase [Ruficoccus amylovorans]|uniref:histidine kinase n=1 Tax=Ruficoccus amylovorans TaxID=1804625 RepID=A0A842HE41_9BACT|nr:HAMP domain-containing sensor histidine kinase [Ruficoccus amylovorans]MBC2593936.1 HAMP domain-containing histidine kinase [Ruficoccus amylovorans]
MKARRHVLAWLGLVLPTLAVGALAFWLLGREQSRLDTLARESEQARARTVADNLDLIMAEIKTGVMQALEAASGPGDEQARLRELVESNPFVGAFAVWESDGSLMVEGGAFGETSGGESGTGDRSPRSLDGRKIAVEPTDEVFAYHYLSGRKELPWNQPAPESENVSTATAAGDLAKASADGAPEFAPVATAFAPDELERDADASVGEASSGSYANVKASRQSIREISQQNVLALNLQRAQEVQEAQAVSENQQMQSRALSAKTELAPSDTVGTEVAVASDADAISARRGVSAGSVQATTAILADTSQPVPGRNTDSPPGAASPVLDVGGDTDSMLAAGGQLEWMPEASPVSLSVPEQRPALLLPQNDLLDGIFVDRTQARSGWVERTDGQPGWLAWYQLVPDGRVTAVLLERDAVLVQLRGAIPEGWNSASLLSPDGVAVFDAYSRYGSGGESVYRKMDTIAVGTELPGWRLGVPPGPVGGGRGFFLLGGLLVAVLCAATLGAGTLLLLQARRDAREAARKTTFVSNVSHELRTPLTTIRMYAEMLEEGRVTDEERRTRYLGTITAETQRLSRLVDNVLDFSRLEQGRKKYRLEPVDVAAVVASVLETLGPRLREAGMEIFRETPAVPLLAHSDRDALGQVLLNLVDNALKYAAGGKLLRIALESASGGRLRLLVEDRGPGIPTRDRERAFGAFQRLDESLTAATPGSGLGLSICRGLLRDLGGDIELLSAEKNGCRFVITLPLANS